MAEKAVDAMLAAIEIYNKPDFRYREESFAILAINAWELLVKAQILRLDGNRVASILVFEKRKNNDGSISRMRYRKMSRSGAPMSIGLFPAIDRLSNEYGESVPAPIRQNLELVCEVRDSAVHSMNSSFDLAKLMQEIGTACVRNFLAAARDWFALDLSVYNFFLMPLAFVAGGTSAKIVDTNREQRKLVAYLATEIQNAASSNTDDYTVSLELDLKFMRTKDSAAQKVVVTNDANATPVTLTEENIRDKYPYDYRALTARLAARYSNFSQSTSYHDVRRALEPDPAYCHERYPDQENRTGTVKRFYSPLIVQEFDKHYQRKS